MTNSPRKRFAKHAFDVASAPPVRGHGYGRRMGDVSEGDPYIWLTSFIDVVALMLTFFVMMYAMSTPETEKFSAMSSALQQELSRVYSVQRMTGAEDTIDIGRVNFDQALDVRYLQALIQSVVERAPELQGHLVVTRRPDALVLSIPESVLFEPGQLAVKTGGGAALFRLAATLSRMKNKVVLVGHDLTSNWGPALARAATVAAVFDNVGYTYPITIQATSGATDEEDLSRRVDIVIMNHDWRRERVTHDSAFP